MSAARHFQDAIVGKMTHDFIEVVLVECITKLLKGKVNIGHELLHPLRCRTHYVSDAACGSIRDQMTGV